MKRDPSQGERKNNWQMSTNLGGPATSAATTSKITRDEHNIITDVEDEFKRRSHFKRIFPSMEYHYYKQFFLHGERPLNKLIDERVMEKRRLKTHLIMQMKEAEAKKCT